MATARLLPKFRHTSSWLWPRYWDVRFWHLASIRCVAKFGRFQTITDIAESWREMARSLLTPSRHTPARSIQADTTPFTAQALTANRISPSGPVGNFARTASRILFRVSSSRDMQYL